MSTDNNSALFRWSYKIFSRFCVSFTWGANDAGAAAETLCMSALKMLYKLCAFAGICDLSPGGYFCGAGVLGFDCDGVVGLGV